MTNSRIYVEILHIIPFCVNVPKEVHSEYNYVFKPDPEVSINSMDENKLIRHGLYYKDIFYSKSCIVLVTKLELQNILLYEIIIVIIEFVVESYNSQEVGYTYDRVGNGTLFCNLLREAIIQETNDLSWVKDRCCGHHLCMK